MISNAYRGVVQSGKIALLDASALLPEGTEVLITPLTKTSGSASAVLAAVEASPRIPAEWVDELEQLIAQGRRPPTTQKPFPEERGVEENG